MTQAAPHEGYTPPEDNSELDTRFVDWETESVRRLTEKLQCSPYTLAELDREQVLPLARFAGDELREYTRDVVAAHVISAGADRKLYIIPGSAEAGLKRYAREGGDIHAKDKSRRDRALQFLQKYAGIAYEKRQSYPEVVLAEAAGAAWHEEGWEEASEAMLLLLASYGLRIQNVLKVQEQRNAFLQRRYDGGPYFGRLVRPPEVPREHL